MIVAGRAAFGYANLEQRDAYAPFDARDALKVTEAINADALTIKSDSMNSDQGTKYVFISSAGHSGSTLLDMLIGSHRDCESLGEMVLLPMEFAMNRVCACGSNIRECVLWSEVARRLEVDTENNSYALNLGHLSVKAGDERLQSPWLSHRARLGHAISYYRYLYKLGILDTLTSTFDEGIQNTFKVYDVVRSIACKRIVVDSSKHHTRAAALYSARPQSVRIIQLVRDGRGVFYSYLKRAFGRKHSLEAWRRHYAHAVPLLEGCVDAKHLMTIRYEDLVADPPGVLNDVCRFLMVPYDPAMLDFRAVVHHNVNGNDMKYESTTGIRLDEAWKTRLPKSDLQYFERKAGPMNRRLGYQ